jgi:hypothetical protein
MHKIKDLNNITLSIGIDTLFINVQYPGNDIYYSWYEMVDKMPAYMLKEGVPAKGFVVSPGKLGYNLCVSWGNVSAYLSKYNVSERADGIGMGILLQIGPLFINMYQDEVYSEILRFLEKLGLPDIFPMTVTRVDLRIDLLGFPIKGIPRVSLENQWVGRAELTKTYSNGPIIQGYEIGSRQSAVFLRIYNKVLEAKKSGDLSYWYRVWGQKPSEVTRIEWQVRPKKGDFPESIKQFALLNSHSMAELGKYLLSWGRLTMPMSNDSVKSRWPLHPLWDLLHRGIEQYSQKPLSELKRTPASYEKSICDLIPMTEGLISTLMARQNPENPNWADVEEKLDWGKIHDDAAHKGQNLLNGGSEKE